MPGTSNKRWRIDSVQDLIEEAKVRTVYWAICIFAIAYFLSHTSKSMWTNIPISILILAAFRYLSYEVELCWRVKPMHRQSYLSHLEKKQLSVNNYRLSTIPTASRWRRKIDSPPVEAAIEDFITKILQDFVEDLWYSSITPDKEAPELIHRIILDALGEVSWRAKEINLVDLLTRDMVDLIGNHIDLYRRNQSAIGVDVMGILSSEERDEKMKQHLLASNELHPALISSESEHKVLQRIVGGILAIVLRPQEAQCPLVRCISRELLTCLVLQPVLNFASPGYINELIEYIFLAIEDNRSGEVGLDRATIVSTHGNDNSFHIENLRSGEPEPRMIVGSNQSNELILSNSERNISSESSKFVQPNKLQDSNMHKIEPRSAEWAMVLEAATKRRTQVLAPENLDNMWTKGRNYKKKTVKLMKPGDLSSKRAISGPIDSAVLAGNLGKELFSSVNGNITGIEDNYMVDLMHGSTNKNQVIAGQSYPYVSPNLAKKQPFDTDQIGDGWEENSKKPSTTNINQLNKSSSAPEIHTEVRGTNSEFTAAKGCYNPNISNDKEEPTGELFSRSEGSLHAPKIKCRVVGAYFEKIGSKSFAVYSIAVTDAENKTWFVKRRYRNFERLHRHLKDISNYTLHLPPKRFLSSSIDDYFVHQRCILLDKYLQDLLSIANVAEQHEVWDFLSVSSKSYSFGKSTSVMKTLAVNVDDAMDDMFRQLKGVSGGARNKIADSSPSRATCPPLPDSSRTLSWNEDDVSKQSPSYSNMETSRSHSDDEVHDEDHSSAHISEWHSDNELNSKGFPPRVVKHAERSSNLDSQRSQQLDKFDIISFDKFSESKRAGASDLSEDLVGVPPEWAPPKVSVPLLNLVDKIFQLNRRGWLRRQVFWISKQILQLMMEDAIDDWIVRQIHWFRNDEVIAQGIRWVQDVLWPNGTFFIKLSSSQGSDTGFTQKSTPSTSQAFGDKPTSFELQLEAARRASYVKKMLLGGAPTPLVSLIGHSQYRRSAKDIYYFTQSKVCLKQLAYGMLELVVISLFPELRDLILDIHKDNCNSYNSDDKKKSA